MQLIKYIEIIIRIAFSIIAILRLIGSAWLSPFKSIMYNFSFFFFIIILLYVSFQSIKNHNLYIFSNILGLFFSLYFTYESIFVLNTSPVIDIFSMFGFVIILFIISSGLHEKNNHIEEV